MQPADRKQAIAAFKKRETVAGIYAVRCAATGQVWIGRSLNLGSIGNRTAFTLRTGGHANRDLQAAWTTHGSASISVEVLERLPEEDVPWLRDRLLTERLQHWRSTLGADGV